MSRRLNSMEHKNTFAWNTWVCETLEQRTLLSAGAPDPSFNNTGVASPNIGSGFTTAANDVAVQSDGKTIVVGYKFNATTPGNFVISRLNLDGTPDTTF